MNTRYKANVALFISVCGLILFFSYAEKGFVYGLFYHGFLAATIGGLADWFAVTAIFKKPLGIAWRADILRRNRQRIMSELVSFVGHDILNTQNIMAVLQKQNLAAFFVEYLIKHGGKERILDSADELLQNCLGTLDTLRIAKEGEPIVKDFIRAIQLDHNMVRLVAKLRKDDNLDWLIKESVELIKNIITSNDMQELLKKNIQEWREKYEDGAMGRSLLFQTMNLTDDNICSILTSKIDARLEILANPDTKKGVQLRGWFKEGLDYLTSNERFCQSVNYLIDSQIDKIDFEKPLAEWLHSVACGEMSKKSWLIELNKILADKIDEFVVNKEWHLIFDSWLKKCFEQQLNINHQVIVDLIEKRLAEFSDDLLIEFVEEKVADDLQMIRINGAIIGSLAGMLLYTITFIIEEVVCV